MVAMVPEQIGPPGNGPCSEPSDIGSSSGSFIRFLRDGPIPIPYSNWTDIEPIVNRYGKQSAPECRRAFCCHIPERTDTSDKEQSRADTINTSREKQNEKKPRREQTEKEATHNQRTSQKNKQRQLNRKQTDQQPKQGKTKNYTHEKETTGVLHPASRLTPENGGIPPFYGQNKLNVRVFCRYR